VIFTTKLYHIFMSSEDLFSVAKKANTKQVTPPKRELKEPVQNIKSNVPEMSVSDLAQSLKRTLEETYGRIRVRGELTGLKLAASFQSNQKKAWM